VPDSDAEEGSDSTAPPRPPAAEGYSGTNCLCVSATPAAASGTTAGALNTSSTEGLVCDAEVHVVRLVGLLQLAWFEAAGYMFSGGDAGAFRPIQRNA